MNGVEINLNEKRIRKVIESYENQAKGRFGLICLNCLINRCSFDDLDNLIKRLDIQSEFEVQTKFEYLIVLAEFFYGVYESDKKIRKQFDDVVDFLGNMLLNDPNIKKNLTYADFISKQELIDKFADFCADLEISVYSTEDIEEYSLDLYLTKRTPLLRTESVIVRTGAELDEESYQKALRLLEESTNIATWLVFVTTPYGAYKIGFNRLIKDMEDLRVWMYIVDPVHKNIYGITRGKKSKDQDDDIRDKFISKLPREPIRAPSQVVKISKYNFSESESYKPKNFMLYTLFNESDLDESTPQEIETKNYTDIFRKFLLISNDSGIPILSFSGEKDSGDEVLVSGFLTAMDNFVSELGGETSLKEINYKGFYIQATYGPNVKAALFLSEPGDKILRQRLEYLIHRFEEDYSDAIAKFGKTGNVSVFNTQEIIDLTKEILKL